MFPFSARDVPIPVAITLRVPQNMESPIPARGPISATFTLLMEEVSKSALSALLSSMAADIPMMAVDT